MHVLAWQILHGREDQSEENGRALARLIQAAGED